MEALRKKYSSYSGVNTKGNISICFDEEVDEGDLTIGDRKFNYNTLEPKIVKVNGLSKMNAIFGTSYCSVEDLHKWMRVNKTDCALKLFETELSFIFPEYIAKAIKNE